MLHIKILFTFRIFKTHKSLKKVFRKIPHFNASKLLIACVTQRPVKNVDSLVTKIV